MINATLNEIINSKVNCSNLTKQLKKEINEAVLQKGLLAETLSLGAKLYILRNNIDEIPKCKSCEKELVFHGPSGAYRTYCSAKCSANSKDTISKRQQTNTVKYGSTNVLTSRKVVENTKNQMLEKHGVEHYKQSAECKKRILNGEIFYKRNRLLQRQRRLEWAYNNVLAAFKDNVIPLFSVNEFYGGGPGKYYKWSCVRCEVEFENYYNRQKGTWPKCPNCDAAHTDIEYFVINLLNQYNIPHKLRDRQTIQNRELDIYVPTFNLAIETNGLYFHSEKKIQDHMYHIYKTKLCREKNIKLIQIFADEIYYNKQLCRSKIKNLLGLNKKINSNLIEFRYLKNCTAFLNKYTFSGEQHAKVKIGAFYKDHLVAVTTFNDNTVAQYATINFFNFGNLIYEFVKKYSKDQNIKAVVYSADVRWEPDLVKNSFEYIQTSDPKCWYTRDYLKRTETFHEGWARVWDCGYNLFIYRSN
jgi:hypothetical protein